MEALIDSGADSTCVPERLAEALELQPISVMLVGGAGIQAENRIGNWENLENIKSRLRDIIDFARQTNIRPSGDTLSKY